MFSVLTVQQSNLTSSLGLANNYLFTLLLLHKLTILTAAQDVAVKINFDESPFILSTLGAAWLGSKAKESSGRDTYRCRAMFSKLIF